MAESGFMPWIEHFRSANWSEAASTVLCAYLLGCVTTGYYLVRWRTGEDLREIGSGALGARNAGRVLGRAGFMLTLLGDFFKGYLAVWSARLYAPDGHLEGMAMLAVVAGHLWPAQLHFHGGKGVATSLGALLVFDYRLAFGFVFLYGICWVLMRQTVLAGMFAYACLPVAIFYFEGNGPKAVVLTLLAILVTLAHRRNIVTEGVRLAHRRETPPSPPRTDL